MAGSTTLILVLVSLLVLFGQQEVICLEETVALSFTSRSHNHSNNDSTQANAEILQSNNVIPSTFNQSFTGLKIHTNNTDTSNRAREPCLPSSNCSDYGGICGRRPNFNGLPPGQCNVIDKTLCYNGKGCQCCLGKKCKKKLRNDECRFERGDCSEKSVCQGDYMKPWCVGGKCGCCLPCKTPSKCREAEGRCTMPHLCRTRADTSIPCNGEVGCVCCLLTDYAVCHEPNSACGGDGKCRMTCLDTEYPDGSCGGSDCKCCKEKACHATDTSCGIGGEGFCRETCLSTEISEGLCPGASCHCCVNKACFNLNGSCGPSSMGQCRDTCLATEDIVDLCDGERCFCCLEKGCHALGNTCGPLGIGDCRETCRLIEEPYGTCPGSDCTCCTEKACYISGKRCGQYNSGSCRATCLSTEEPAGICDGANCTCCVEKACHNLEGFCGPSSSGRCQESCLSTEYQQGVCEGMDCKCCVEKACHNVNARCGITSQGSCRENCLSTEFISGLCTGADCKCCEEKACHNINNTCGDSNNGLCRNKCLEIEDAKGSCPGAECSCCFEKACHFANSTCGDGGICRTPCLDNEVPNGVCDGVDCTCCVVPACPGGFLSIGEQCFKIFPSLSSWDDASATCTNAGLVLAEPNDPSAVAVYISLTTGTTKDYWIGGRGNGTIFTWQFGSYIPDDWNYWRPANPVSTNADSCLLLHPVFTTQPLTSEPCRNTYYPLCEKI